MSEGAEMLRDLMMAAKEKSRADCVRSAVAAVRIEGGDVDHATQSLLADWAGGDLSDEDLMQAILKPYAGPL